jgi:hypothetical protein
VSTAHDAAVLFGGRNLVTGESEGFGGQLAAGIGLITPAGGGQIRAAGKALSATGHFVHQAINRGVKPGAILDALRNPLKVNPIKVDDLGRPSQSIVGRGATVVQNPETGALITTHPTSSRLRDRLLREQ